MRFGMSKNINILAYVKLYPPSTNAGAELMLHEILVELRKRGHNVIVAQDSPTIGELDGIKIFSYENIRHTGFRPDVIFTQNHDTPKAIVFAQSIQKPIVHFIHNDKSARVFRLSKRNASLIVANSGWVYNSINVPGINKIIITPPTDLSKYETDRSSANKITFINLIDIKGVDMFWQIARIMSDREFLAVKGGYGDQVLNSKPIENVEVVENTSDMKSIYSKTKILLVLSKYESWGRVGIEAISSGIPVIATRTPGLQESLKESAIFIEHGDLASLVEAIRYLDSEDNYQEYSLKSKVRSREVFDKFNDQINNLETILLKMTA
jgi:glycosyltransferase involved in cell wall biosynthesis